MLDNPVAGLPPGIEGAVAGLDPGELRRAALACADLLDATAPLAAVTVGACLPLALAGYVRRRLEALPE